MTATLSDTNLFGVARQALYELLESALPGRVRPYAPAAPVATPAIWIDRHDSHWESPHLWIDFTVVCVADGSSVAGQAMLDEATSAVFTAVAAAAGGIRYEGHTATSLTVAADVTLRAQECAISVAAGVANLCPPNGHVAHIPPEQIDGGLP